jgi:DUF971 family protein
MEPKPKEISEFSETTLLIIWNDGHESLYLYEDLRNACPCASCTGSEKWGGKGKPAFKKTIPIGAKSTYVRPNEIEDIGLYAVRFKWNDGHETGIYTFEFLRELCTCDECKPVA